MKRLNKKGFTLIELLAVIVILAVVMVVTIPSVLNAMGNARQKQLDNVRIAMTEYVQKNYDLCSSGITGDFDDVSYDTTLFPDAPTCTLTAGANGANIITGAGYTSGNKGDIASVTANCTNGKCEVTLVTANTNDGKFKGLTSPANSR